MTTLIHGCRRPTATASGTANPLNQEVVTVRGTMPGECIVNLQNYQSHTDTAVPVTVSVNKVNPRLTVVFYETLTLDAVGDERTAIRFTVDAQGNVTELSRLQKSLRGGP